MRDFIPYPVLFQALQFAVLDARFKAHITMTPTPHGVLASCPQCQATGTPANAQGESTIYHTPSCELSNRFVKAYNAWLN